MKQLVAAVERAVGDWVTARRHTPPAVEISVMQRPGSEDLIVHAVNYGVDLDGSVTPAENVRISVRLPSGNQAARVEWHALDGITETLKMRHVNGRAEFTVPKLEIYAIALVKC